ncbi:MAG: hypothetical protein WBW07_00080, partial [Azonexus sp.]
MTLEQFIALWTDSKLTERAGAQAHFDDLCDCQRNPGVSLLCPIRMADSASVQPYGGVDVPGPADFEYI